MGGQKRWRDERAVFTWDYPFVLHSNQSWLDLPRLTDAFLGDILATYATNHTANRARTELSYVKTQGLGLRVTAQQDPKILSIFGLWFQGKLKVIFWFHIWEQNASFYACPLNPEDLTMQWIVYLQTFIKGRLLPGGYSTVLSANLQVIAESVLLCVL